MYWGKISINECINITSDHGGGINANKKDAYDICCHPNILSEPSLNRATSFAWIILPKKLTIYLSSGQPCKSEWNEWDFLLNQSDR